MLHPVLDQLRALKLDGMLEALVAQKKQKDVHQLEFEERLGLLTQHEIAIRESRRIKRRLQAAKRKHRRALKILTSKEPENWISKLSCLLKLVNGLKKAEIF